jgi:peptidoglycan endopeptidase LytE
MNELISKIFDLFVISMMNQPYIWGGDDPLLGFDCSGLVMEWFKTCGFYNGQDMNAQQIHDYLRADSSRFIPIPLHKGSLVFFGKSRIYLSHVGILISKQYMLEAGGGNHTTVNKEISAKQNAYVRIRPLAHRKDLIAIITPNYPKGA